MAHSFRDPDHLPNQRPSGQAADPAGLPRHRRGTTPQMHGRFPDYDVLEMADHWDEVTRELVLGRVHDVPPLRFFSFPEAMCIGAFLDVVLAQDSEPKIPVLALVDAKLHEAKLDGYRYEDMPDDRDTWRIVARGLDESARTLGAESFAHADPDVQHTVVGRFAEGKLSGGAWEELNSTRAWGVVIRAALSEFYSHPWAWNEIGFAGPAYPRGYMRLHQGPDGREPYESEEAFGMDPVIDVPARGLS